MMGSACLRLLLAGFALLVSTAASAQPIQWWKAEPTVKELGWG